MTRFARPITFAAGLLAGLGITQAALAQQPRRASVSSSDATPADLRCGVDYQALRAAAASVLRQNGYTIVQQNEHVYVFIDASALAPNIGCFLTLDVQFHFFANIRAPWGANYSSAQVVLCRESTMLSGSASSLPERTRAEVASLVQICISEEEKQRR